MSFTMCIDTDKSEYFPKSTRETLGKLAPAETTRVRITLNH